MPSFSLRVINPRVPPFAVRSNVNWSEPPHESRPDTMPTPSEEVWFINMPSVGKFQLWAIDSTGQMAGSQESPRITAEDGAAYIWDMAANTVTKVGEKSDTSDTSPKPPSILDNQWVRYGLYGVGGFIALKFLRIIR